jgi:hypothetical protein
VKHRSFFVIFFAVKIWTKDVSAVGLFNLHLEVVLEAQDAEGVATCLELVFKVSLEGFKAQDTIKHLRLVFSFFDEISDLCK